jgi:ribonuclease HI
MQKKEIIIYTDGACLGNPGRGGYAAVLMSGEHRKEISQGFRLTTNNRMEIMAVVEALKTLKSPQSYKVRIFSDSRLVVNAVNLGWISKWKKNNWRKSAKEAVINPDLWIQFDELISGLDIEFNWVEAHVGIKENERCDLLSKQAANAPELEIDEIYELTAKGAK